MRWHVKPIIAPALGEIRKVTKFAYLPTKVENAIIWLETFYSYKEYMKIAVPISIGHVEWEYEWVEIKRGLKND
jgi:hypothetical protein